MLRCIYLLTEKALPMTKLDKSLSTLHHSNINAPEAMNGNWKSIFSLFQCSYEETFYDVKTGPFHAIKHLTSGNCCSRSVNDFAFCSIFTRKWRKSRLSNDTFSIFWETKGKSNENRSIRSDWSIMAFKKGETWETRTSQTSWTVARSCVSLCWQYYVRPSY